MINLTPVKNKNLTGVTYKSLDKYRFFRGVIHLERYTQTDGVLKDPDPYANLGW